jgi:hypothetical protein
VAGVVAGVAVVLDVVAPCIFSIATNSYGHTAFPAMNTADKTNEVEVKKEVEALHR